MGLGCWGAEIMVMAPAVIGAGFWSWMIMMAGFSPSRIQGMIRGHGVGGACSHIKAFGSHIKGNSVLKACWADMP